MTPGKTLFLPALLAGAFGIALAVVPASALAHGGGHGGGMGQSNSSMGGFGGNSMGHISSQGLANTNGPNAADRDMGLERAEDRMSDQGLAHSQGLAKHDTDLDTDADSDKSGADTDTDSDSDPGD